jgi:hypothetical protein
LIPLHLILNLSIFSQHGTLTLTSLCVTIQTHQEMARILDSFPPPLQLTHPTLSRSTWPSCSMPISPNPTFCSSISHYNQLVCMCFLSFSFIQFLSFLYVSFPFLVFFLCLCLALLLDMKCECGLLVMVKFLFVARTSNVECLALLLDMKYEFMGLF